MTDILVSTREALPGPHDARQQGAPQFFIHPARQGDTFPPTPVGDSNAAGEVSPRNDPEAPLSLGSLFYLGCVGLIAAVIVVVLFGAGFSLLAPTAGGAISGSDDRRGDPE